MAIESVNRTAAIYPEASGTVSKPEKQTETKSTDNMMLKQQVTRSMKETQMGKNNKESSEQQSNDVSAERIKQAINNVNNKMKHTKTKCEFSYHEPTKRVSIKVIDKDTEEVIREIPPEETLEMIEKMWEISGMIVDARK